MSTFSNSFGYLLCFATAVVAGAAAEATPRRFSFVPTESAGTIVVLPEDHYSPRRGFGIESAFPPKTFPGGIGGDPAFYFSVDVPEGDYRVTINFHGASGGSTATVKAELRRLMLGPLSIPEGRSVTHTFMVNVRSPQIAAANGVAAGKVDLKAPRETELEAWAWDDRLTLELNGERVRVRAIEIAPVVVPRIFLLGDSTVCDQSREPYASWGQVLTRMLKDSVVVANHGQSGETYRDSLVRRRIDKIVSVIRPGDWVLLQFGHNDQKQLPIGTGGPFTTYKEELKRHVFMIRAAGGIPVILSSMERRRFAGTKVSPSLTDYAEAARQSAAEAGVAFIDLNTLSQRLYEALGPEKSAVAFAAPGGKVDNTHHNAYGAWLLARCVAAEAHSQQIAFAKHLYPEFHEFDAARPDPVEAVSIPPSPVATQQRPLGN